MEHHSSCIFGAFYARVFVVEVGGEALDVACRFPLCHGEVVEKIVATGGWGGAGNFVGVVDYILEGTEHEGAHFVARPLALHDEVVAGEASHRAPVDDAVFPFWVVAQEGGNNMLYGVDGGNVQGRLLVGGSHAYVVGGDGVLAHGVLAGDVDTGHEVAVVNLEGGYEVHSFRGNPQTPSAFQASPPLWGEELARCFCMLAEVGGILLKG